ncbi:MAG: 4'-phosphopantetheinyl transferase superfamily protein [Actinomycetota bacterium]|nr:4'-phosphopantetheinyl transferase superfamily protein [Actinomycetota bacterium]
MIEELLPPGVAASEAFADDEAEPVHPGEAHVVVTSVPSRRREFVTARRCAREALIGIGVAPGPILPGPRREPVWPEGVIGSITHCAGYRGAAVARQGALESLGIDAEPHAPLPDGILEAVTSASERRHLAGLAARDPEICWDRVLFSAKESVYKAWFPLARRMLGFDEAELSFEAGAFTARLLVPGTRVDGRPPLTVFRGRFLVKDGLVLTAVASP